MCPSARWPRHSLILLLAAVGTFGTEACAPRGARPEHRTAVPASVIEGVGLVLAESEGEKRFRRPQEGPRRRAVTEPIILKVDSANGGSTQLFMGYEDVPPGESIQRHYHPHADEILFIHRGQGVAFLDAREARFEAGTTIYVPHGTRVSLRNTGTERVTVAFIFADPTMSNWFRDGTVAEGQPAPLLTPADVAARRARHREHIVIEP